MATEDFDNRDLKARERRKAESGMSGTAIVLGLFFGALMIGFVAFNYIDRTPAGSSATSERPTVSAPQTQPRIATPPASTTPAPAPSTK